MLRVHTFQSLTGRLKTHIDFQVDGPRHMFQSLTGRLKTARSHPAHRGVSRRFQSLTGRLKTRSLRAQLRALPPFQSLTGRLKTVPLLRKRRRR